MTQPKLLSVNLTNNLIDDVLPGTFANMTRLVRLILTRNRLSKLQPNSMAGENDDEDYTQLSFVKDTFIRGN